MKTMNFKFSKLFRLAVISLAIVFLAASCGQKKGKNQIKMLYANWAEGIAMTHLAKVALEEKGYEVDIKAIDPGPIYASLAKGDGDIFVDAWLPHTHAAYWDRFGDKLEVLGTSFEDGTTGLVVPQYVSINSISELNDHVDEFEGDIIGIDSGAGIHRNTEKVIDEYGLNFNQVTSSEPAMLAALRKAYNKQEWIVITGWKPHLMWADYDLKYLEDPKGVYPQDECKIVARLGFKSDHPELTRFFHNFTIDEPQLYELIGLVLENDDRLKVVRGWYEENKALVDSWWN